MTELLNLIKIADKYNLEIRIVPDSWYAVDIRRYVADTKTKDMWVKSKRFSSYDLKNTNVSFEDLCKEIDRDFTEAFEHFLETGEHD